MQYSDSDDSLTDQSNFKIRMMGGNDYLEVTGGINNFANGNIGDDEFIVRAGQGEYLGGAGGDSFEFTGGTNNYANGQVGEDTMKLYAGQGTYLGGADNDNFVVWSADDGSQVNGNGGADDITGKANITYRGGSDNDRIAVSQGLVYGDKNADKFVSVKGDGYAVIQDYTIGEDVVEITMNGSWSKIDSGLLFTDDSGDQIMLLVGISEIEQVTLI